MIVPCSCPTQDAGTGASTAIRRGITDLKTTDIKATVEAHLGSVRHPVEIGLFGGNVFGLEAGNLRRLFTCFEPYRERITGFRISTKPIPLDDEIIEILKENG